MILNGVKSISYAANQQATRIATDRGADEAVLVRPDGVVLEAPTSSVFWVSPEGGLRTPSLEVGILESITRALLARELHVEEGAWPIDDLLAADEAFLASTTREVQAISAIDAHPLAAVPGERTVAASDAFARVLAAELGTPSSRTLQRPRGQPPPPRPTAACRAGSTRRRARPAAGARGRDRLPVGVVDEVADREHAGQVRPRGRLGDLT